MFVVEITRLWFPSRARTRDAERYKIILAVFDPPNIIQSIVQRIRNNFNIY